MAKIALAVIKYEDKVLLIRRASDQSFAGSWEFPGYEVEDGERVSKALKQGLEEVFGIQSNVKKLITSISSNGNNVFAYEVKYCDGLIKIPGHDNMEWTTLNNALKYNLSATTKKIVMHITNTKEPVKKPESLTSVIDRFISKPLFDKETNKYVVSIKNGFFGQSRSFTNQESAIHFYMDTVRDIVKTIQNRQYIPQNSL